jgi:bacterioferritin-associated ferredoxin
MYVCICRQITDSQIRKRCEEGVSTFSELRAELGLASDCGRCGHYAREIIAEVASAAQCRAMSYAA